MNILYGINTNGQGHINRARTIIQELQKHGFEVDCLFSGPKPPTYAYDISDRCYHFEGYTLFYNRHSLNLMKSIIKNITPAAKIPSKVSMLKKFHIKREYEYIITDFDVYSSLLGRIEKIPTISIDHQHSIIHPKASLPKKNHLIKSAMIGSIYLGTPHKDYYFAIDYVNDINKIEDGSLYPLLWKSELEDFQVYQSDQITVYLSHISRNKVINHFKQYPEQKFNVYGFDIDARIENIEFKQTSRDGFLEDLCSSKGVISNAGFSLTWESSILNKPMYIIPHKSQYEQIVNAYRLNRRQNVITSKFLNTKSLNRFLNMINSEKVNRTNEINVRSTRSFYNNLNRVMAKIS